MSEAWVWCLMILDTRLENWWWWSMVRSLLRALVPVVTRLVTSSQWSTNHSIYMIDSDSCSDLSIPDSARCFQTDFLDHRPPWSFTWSNMRISPRVDPRHDLLWDTPLHNTLKHPVSQSVSEAAVKIFQKIGSSRLTLLLQRMTKSFAFSPLLSCFTDLKFTFHEQNIIMNQWMTFLNQAPLF